MFLQDPPGDLYAHELRKHCNKSLFFLLSQRRKNCQVGALTPDCSMESLEEL